MFNVEFIVHCFQPSDHDHDFDQCFTRTYAVYKLQFPEIVYLCETDSFGKSGSSLLLSYRRKSESVSCNFVIIQYFVLHCVMCVIKLRLVMYIVYSN